MKGTELKCLLKISCFTFCFGRTSCPKMSPLCTKLQQEAQQALMELISTMFNRNLSRFAWILQLITSLHDIDADAIEELLFRSLLGEATLN